MGVHTPEEVSQFGCADLKVLSDMLADKPFFFGDEPTTVNKISSTSFILNKIILYSTSYKFLSISFQTVGRCSICTSCPNSVYR